MISLLSGSKTRRARKAPRHTYDFDTPASEDYQVHILGIGGLPGIKATQHIPNARLLVDKDGSIWTFGTVDLTPYASSSIFNTISQTADGTYDVLTVPAGSTGIIVTYVSLTYTASAGAIFTVQDSCGNTYYTTTAGGVGTQQSPVSITLLLPNVKLAPGCKLQFKIAASGATVSQGTTAASARLY